MVYLFILSVMLFTVIVMTYFFYMVLTVVQTILLFLFHKAPWVLLILLAVGLYLIFKPC